MKKYLLFTICGLFLTSCVTQRRCMLKFPPDTVTHVSIVYRDSIIPVYIPKHDTVFGFTNIHDTLIVHSGTAHGQSWVIHDTLKMNVWQSDTTLKVKIDSCIKIIDSQKKEIFTIREKYVPGFWRFCGYAFIGICIALIGFIVFKILK
jgi:hypothetical protein